MAKSEPKRGIFIDSAKQYVEMIHRSVKTLTGRVFVTFKLDWSGCTRDQILAQASKNFIIETRQVPGWMESMEAFTDATSGIIDVAAHLEAYSSETKAAMKEAAQRQEKVAEATDVEVFTETAKRLLAAGVDRKAVQGAMPKGVTLESLGL